MKFGFAVTAVAGRRRKGGVSGTKGDLLLSFG
jgi:hypothetical protein